MTTILVGTEELNKAAKSNDDSCSLALFFLKKIKGTCLLYFYTLCVCFGKSLWWFKWCRFVLVKYVVKNFLKLFYN